MSGVRSAESKSPEVSAKNLNLTILNVTMNRNLLLHNLKVYCLKCKILNLEKPVKQNVDLTSMQILANLPSKRNSNSAAKTSWTSTCDVSLCDRDHVNMAQRKKSHFP